MIDLRHLRRFVVVCEELSFSRAAERLGISQPAMTTLISGLEKELGLDLFIRERHRIVGLTAAGKQYLAQVQAILAGLDASIRSAKASVAGLGARLRLGVCEETTSRGLVRFIEALRAAMPDLSVDVHEATPDGIAQLVVHRDVDLAFGIAPVLALGLQARPVWTEEWSAVVPVHHALAGRDVIACEDLVDVGLILNAPAPCGAHELVRRAFHRIGATPQVAIHAERRSTVLALVAAGVGVTILPYSSAVKVLVDGTMIVPFKSPPPVVSAIYLDAPSEQILRVLDAVAQT